MSAPPNLNNSTPHPIPITEEIFVDASFVSPEGNSFDFPIAERQRSLLNHLTELITRQPNNLRLHMQRIRLADRLNAVEPLAEAISDLFIVLKEKGIELRAGLLKKYWEKIPEEWSNSLNKSFVNGVSAETRLPGRTRLTAANVGRNDFLTLQRPTNVGQEGKISDENTLKTVRDMIDGEQLEAACSLLEEWLPDAQEDFWQDGAQELARLYLYLENGEERAQAWWDILWHKSQQRAELWAKLLTQDGSS